MSRRDYDRFSGRSSGFGGGDSRFTNRVDPRMSSFSRDPMLPRRPEDPTAHLINRLTSSSPQAQYAIASTLLNSIISTQQQAPVPLMNIPRREPFPAKRGRYDQYDRRLSGGSRVAGSAIDQRSSSFRRHHRSPPRRDWKHESERRIAERHSSSSGKRAEDKGVKRADDKAGKKPEDEKARAERDAQRQKLRKEQDKRARKIERERRADVMKRFEGIPTILLYCHICKKRFAGYVSFDIHIRGQSHHKLCLKKEAYNEQKLMLLRKESRIEEDIFLSEVDLIQEKKKVFRQRKRCEICRTAFSGSLNGHRDGLQHQRLKQFLHPTCGVCDYVSRTRIDFEKHLLSAGHLQEVTKELRSVRENLDEEALKASDMKLLEKYVVWNAPDALDQEFDHPLLVERLEEKRAKELAEKLERKAKEEAARKAAAAEKAKAAAEKAKAAAEKKAAEEAAKASAEKTDEGAAEAKEEKMEVDEAKEDSEKTAEVTVKEVKEGVAETKASEGDGKKKAAENVEEKTETADEKEDKQDAQKPDDDREEDDIIMRKYDFRTPLGVELIRNVTGYYCQICRSFFEEENEAKSVHCRTRFHQDNYHALERLMSEQWIEPEAEELEEEPESAGEEEFQVVDEACEDDDEQKKEEEESGEGVTAEVAVNGDAAEDIQANGDDKGVKDEGKKVEAAVVNHDSSGADKSAKADGQVVKADGVAGAGDVEMKDAKDADAKLNGEKDLKVTKEEPKEEPVVSPRRPQRARRGRTST